MKFIKKPIPINAIKCTKDNEQEIILLLDSCVTKWEKVLDSKNEIIGFNIHSWEGIDPVYYDVILNENGNGKPYWIMKGLKGECYPCVADDIDDAPLGYELFKE